jgi:hypothetical protein
MPRFDGGWVKLWRASVFGDIGKNFTRAGIFGALVSMANIKPSIATWMGKPRKIARGEMVTSMHEIAKLGGCDVKTVARHLNYLALRETIKVEKTPTGTFIKVLNYEKYQGQDAEDSTPPPHDIPDHMEDGRHTIGIHSKEGKNIRRKERKNSYTCDFEFNIPFSKFPVQIKGPGAEKKFAEQIKTQEDFDALNRSLDNYNAYLKLETWRKPKQSFAAYLGTEKTGFFWKEWIHFDSKSKKIKPANQIDWDQEAEYFISAAKKFNESDSEALRSFLNDETRYKCFVQIGRSRINEMPTYHSHGRKELAKLIKGIFSQESV